MFVIKYIITINKSYEINDYNRKLNSSKLSQNTFLKSKLLQKKKNTVNGGNNEKFAVQVKPRICLN